MICLFALIYVDYRIIVAEWDGDLTMLEKLAMLQVKILMSASCILLVCEAVHMRTRRANLLLELYMPYVFTVAICISAYIEMVKIIDELWSGKAENGKVDPPKAMPNLGFFYFLILLLALELIACTLVIGYLISHLVAGCGSPNLCK